MTPNRLPRIVRDFMEFEGDLYEVLRVINESHNPVIDVWREHLMADKVFRREGFLFFTRKVDDAVIVEDKVTKPNKNDTNITEGIQE